MTKKRGFKRKPFKQVLEIKEQGGVSIIDNQKIGSYAFLLGAFIALVTGVFGGFFASVHSTILLILFFLGLVVGLLNIQDKEINKFLVATIALLLVGSASLFTNNFSELDNLFPGFGTVLQVVLVNISIFVLPAALVVSLKAIYNLAREP